MDKPDEQVIRRLDLIYATLRLAFEPQVSAARNTLRADAVASAILDNSLEWIPSATLQKAVSKATGKSTRTVRDRLPDLTLQGVLEHRGSDKRLEYRRTELI